MKKILILCLVLVLAMGTLGVGYALWSETLEIDGTVVMGEVDVQWSLDSYGVVQDKDVSIMAVRLDSVAEPNDTMVIDVTCAYPCAYYWVYFDITSIGCVPVHVGEFMVDFGDFAGVAEWGVEWYGPCQLHQNESGYGLLWFHFNNEAVENATYTFSGTVTAGQYNEFTCGPTVPPRPTIPPVFN